MALSKRLTILIHGESGHGKSWLGVTAPGPRLFLDVEGRALYTPTGKATWDGRSALPSVQDDGNPITTDTTVVVRARTVNDLDSALKWLQSGNHYFRSVTLDSITDAQEKYIKGQFGDNSLDQQAWGDVFRRLNNFVFDLIELRDHPANPLDAIVIIAASDGESGTQRPYLSGQLRKKLPFRFDVVGFLETRFDQTSQQEYRLLLIKPYGAARPVVAKDNTDLLSRIYGPSIPNPNVSDMLTAINPPPLPAAGSTTTPEV